MEKESHFSFPSYETIFLTRSEIGEKELEQLNEWLEKIVSQHQGEVILKKDWGKKTLSYPIDKEFQGRYHHFAYTGDNKMVQEIESHLRRLYKKDILRFLTIKLKNKTDVFALYNKPEEAQ